MQSNSSMGCVYIGKQTIMDAKDVVVFSTIEIKPGHTRIFVLCLVFVDLYDIYSVR